MLSNLVSKLAARWKSPAEAVSALQSAVATASKRPDDTKAVEEVSRCVAALKTILFGDGTTPPQEAECGQLAQLACDTDLLLLLASNLDVMAFETRKNTGQVFNNLLRRQIPSDEAVISFVAANNGAEVLRALVKAYDSNETALNAGTMLRECLRDEALAKMFSRSDLFWRFFELVQVSDFDVASDAFTSFKDILLRHQAPVAEFVEEEFDKFFEHYNGLLRSHNYVARRHSLKLLGEILLERSYFNVMTRYIASADNLKVVMNLLLDNRKTIQYEAFHVFKVFVANPNKPEPVRRILVKNKSKLLSFLNELLVDREDEEFHEERAIIIEEIERI